jgi:tetratricopeptide (TPR) repeat protein
MTAFKAARINYLAGNCSAARSFAHESITSAKALDARGELGAGGKTVYGAAYETLALAHFCLGNAAQVLPNLQQALQSSQSNFGEDDPETIRIRARLADYFFSTNNPATGTAMLDEAQRRLQNQPPGSSSRLYQDALAVISHAQTNAGRAESALVNTRKLLELRPGLDASPTLAAVLRDQARTLLILKQPTQARQALDRAVAMRVKSGLTASRAIEDEEFLRKTLAQSTQP